MKKVAIQNTPTDLLHKVEARLQEYLTRNRNDRAPYLTIKASHVQGGRLHFRMIFGPVQNSTIDPNNLRPHGLFYDEDSLEEESFINKARTEIWASTGNNGGPIGKAFINASKKAATGIKIGVCSPTDISVEPTEYYQQLTRSFPHDYPESMHKRSKVTLGRLSVGFYISYTSI